MEPEPVQWIHIPSELVQGVAMSTAAVMPSHRPSFRLPSEFLVSRQYSDNIVIMDLPRLAVGPVRAHRARHGPEWPLGDHLTRLTSSGSHRLAAQYAQRSLCG